MNPFHEHLSRQLADKLRRRRIVVWYDEHEEFVDFIEELSAGVISEQSIHPVRVGEVDATLARLRECVISLRLDLEFRVAEDWPAPLLVYLPGEARPAKFEPLVKTRQPALAPATRV